MRRAGDRIQKVDNAEMLLINKEQYEKVMWMNKDRVSQLEAKENMQTNSKMRIRIGSGTLDVPALSHGYSKDTFTRSDNR